MIRGATAADFDTVVCVDRAGRSGMAALESVDMEAVPGPQALHTRIGFADVGDMATSDGREVRLSTRAVAAPTRT